MAIVVVWVIMVWVIPAFKQVFASFGADLPAPTLIVMAMSDFVVAWWWLIFLAFVGVVVGLAMLHRRSEAFRYLLDRVVAQVSDRRRHPREGDDRPLDTNAADHVRRRACRWSNRSTPSAGAAGNAVYAAGTKRIQTEVSTGTSLTNAMTNTKLFPSMVLQMVQIGEESGSLDNMLGKIADFYEREVDDAVAALSSLLEPIIIVFLGTVIGGLVVAMYLPIFKLGQVV